MVRNIADDLGIADLTNYRQIGEGASAIVYAAEDATLNRNVAVKVFESALDEVTRRVATREMQLMGSLGEHPNIVTLFQSGFLMDGRPYVVMELLENGSLDDLIRRSGPLPWRDAISMILPIASALGFAHDRGVLHGDPKPANILLNADNQPKLTDFGVGAGRMEGQTYVTLAYAAPEVFDADLSPDERSDLYTLAMTLYVLVAGKPPFHGQSSLQTIRAVQEQNVPALNVNQELDQFFQIALSKDPLLRPAMLDIFLECWLMY